MDERQTGSGNASGGPADNRLDSWKRIAQYLKRDVTTVQRWERREAMPVHRHQHAKLGSVFAYRTELDAWWASRGTQLAEREAGSNPAGAPGPAATEPSTPASRPATTPRHLVLAGIAALLLAAAAAWYLRDSVEPWRNPLAEAKVTRLTQYSGAEQAAAISRDGRLVAFLADRDGPQDAWLMEIGSTRYRNLTRGQLAGMSNPSLRTLSFTPDNTLVAIWTRHGDGSRPEDIYLTGAPVAGGPLQLYLREAAEIDWSADGRQQVFHTTAPGDPLFIRAAGEADAHQIYVAPRGIHCHFPTWSPDGEFIYFVRGEPPSANWDLWRVRPSGAGLERLSFHNAWVGYPVMLNARELLYLANDSDGSGPWLYVMDLRHLRSHRISFGLERYTSLAANADGTRLVATIANFRSGLWRVPLVQNAVPQTTASPVALAAQNAATPRFGPDYLAYATTDGDRRGIWKLAHGKASELWAEPGIERISAPAIAPDGRHLAFTIGKRDVTQLFVMDSDGHHVNTIPTSANIRGDIAWSPDSKSIVGAIVRDGEPRLVRMPLDGSPPQPMAAEYSVNPVWSADGRYFVYSGADVGTTFPLRAAGPDGRPYTKPNLIMTRGARRVAFLQHSTKLVILRGDISHKNLWLYDPANGDERQLTDLPANVAIGDFDVSPDGTEIIFDRVESDNSSIALIERAR
jgi:Tol biopolymer transport system component